MVTLLEFMGGQTNLSTAVDTTLDYRYRFWRITLTATGKVIFIPPITQAATVTGGPVFFIANIGTNSFTVRDTELVNPTINVAANKSVIVVGYTLANGTVSFAQHLINYAGS